MAKDTTQTYMEQQFVCSAFDEKLKQEKNAKFKECTDVYYAGVQETVA